MLKIIFNKTALLHYLLTIIGLLLIVLLATIIEEPKVIYAEHWKKMPIIVYQNKPDTFTEDKLISYLKDLNIKYPEVVYAQAIIESGNFTSKQFKKDNNLFGMQKARCRITLSLDSKGNYAKFNTWRESVIDYGFYQSQFIKKIKSRDDYINYLGNNYAKSSIYKDVIEKTVNRIKNKF